MNNEQKMISKPKRSLMNSLMWRKGSLTSSCLMNLLMYMQGLFILWMITFQVSPSLPFLWWSPTQLPSPPCPCTPPSPCPTQWSWREGRLCPIATVLRHFCWSDEVGDDEKEDEEKNKVEENYFKRSLEPRFYLNSFKNLRTQTRNLLSLQNQESIKNKLKMKNLMRKMRILINKTKEGTKKGGGTGLVWNELSELCWLTGEDVWEDEDWRKRRKDWTRD